MLVGGSRANEQIRISPPFAVFLARQSASLGVGSNRCYWRDRYWLDERMVVSIGVALIVIGLIVALLVNFTLGAVLLVVGLVLALVGR